jgi:hypothetical protein
VRLARRKFYAINEWQIVKELFQARDIDPRLAGLGWVADMLLEDVPQEGYLPVTGGVLDAETVWGLLLKQQLRLEPSRPDLVGLLRWSMDEDAVELYRRAPEEFRKAATDWVAESAGPATEIVFECIQANQRPDALPIGLALGVVSNPAAAGKLDKAAGRIEKYLGNAHIDSLIAQRWYVTATDTVRSYLPDPKARRSWLLRADEILQAVQADEYAYLSDTSPLGFEQRLARFGQVLSNTLDSGSAAPPEGFNQAYNHVLDHDEAQVSSRSIQRVEMAARLARWLARMRVTGVREAASLADAAREHALTGGFVDWARQTLRGGEPVRELADAYSRLLAKVSEVVEQKNRRFAHLFRDWTAAGSPGDEVVPVERILDEIAAPLAAHAPLLVLVVDGMSYAVFRELLDDITREDWTEIRRRDRGPIWPGIAAMPSVTEVCRASLLCGKLRQGQSSDEKIGFAEHTGLVRHSHSGLPPVLFHKDVLQKAGGAGPAQEVLRELEAPRRRVVGVVINAVDDQLLKGDQLDTRWTGDEIKILPKLLYEARTAGRLVIMLTDHGHVLDYQTDCRPYQQGDRWRSAQTAPSIDEVEITGTRVVIPENRRLVAPWSERVRYSVKKNGYHGGVTLQEMVLPIAVLMAGDDLPEGWIEVAADAPDWWASPAREAPLLQASPPAPPAPPKKRRKRTLFDSDLQEQITKEALMPTGTTSADIASVLDRLLSSPVIEDQKRLAGRALPPDEVIRKMLSVLLQQGGKLTSAALARRMDLPVFRLSGLLAAIQRVVNVEGYPILTRDDVSDTIELNCELLYRQFELT